MGFTSARQELPVPALLKQYCNDFVVIMNQEMPDEQWGGLPCRILY